MARWENANYLAWVRSLPCCNCRSELDVEAHHIKGVGGFSGVGMKAPDYLTMSLCAECHRAVHGGHVKLKLQWEWAARTLANFMYLVTARMDDETVTLLVRGVTGDQVTGGRR